MNAPTEPEAGEGPKARGGGWAVRCWFTNERYVIEYGDVQTVWGLVEQLAIRRCDGQEIGSWDELQVLKNELAGPERVAIEVYPAMSELVNKQNVRHLWVLPEGFRLPIPPPDVKVFFVDPVIERAVHNAVTKRGAAPWEIEPAQGRRA